jgi:sulfur-carrier protein adenylyltransferase/sulfurtransferase
VIKLILNLGTPMIGKYYIYDALGLRTKLVETGKNPDCPLCGKRPKIESLTGGGGTEWGRGDFH